MERVPALERRKVLGGIGGAALAGTAGCLNRIRATIERSPPEQVSLSIRTVPADEDSEAIRIARRLLEGFEAVGIDATLELQTERQLLRDVLLDHDFDVFVTRHPGIADPDQLRPLLHSQYAEESGWQNPFGFSSPRVDELLERQVREHPDPRRETISEIQREVLRRQPFSVVAYPDHETAVSESLANDWNLLGFSSYDSLLTVGPDVPERETLRIGILDPSPTENWNPFAVEFRSHNPILDLIYEPLAKRVSDAFVPWLAADWETDDWRISVTLREDLTWHDGEPLTPEDVAFSYRFLGDTALGTAESPVPAPRFRDRTSLVDSVTVSGPGEVTLTVAESAPEVRQRILTVPVVPEHHWRDRSELLQGALTEALVVDNEAPVGSGPLRFVGAEQEQGLELERVQDHFVTRSEIADQLGPYAGTVPFERLELSVEPNGLAAIELVADGDLEAVATPLGPDPADRVRSDDRLRLLTERTNGFYLIGYNTRRHPLGSHNLRVALSRLVDRIDIVETVFDGRAEPSDTPVLRSAHVPADLLWMDESSLGSFPGTDGELDEDAARELIRDAGFRFNEDGELITQQ